MTGSIRNAIRIAIATDKSCPAEPLPGISIPDLFGRDVFDMRTMRERLPQDVFLRIEQAAGLGESLLPGDADVVANSMKDWAIENGATHYTHWFQPMHGLTAEKHDAFLSLSADGQVINEFSGKTLIKGEPDASSLPSGGIRSTFEARGYTAWDPTSPAFILENSRGKTLYVPTMFFSYTGEALDRKTPLLRSIASVSGQALRVLRLFGNTSVTGVSAMVGAEQEYFLVDRRLYKLRQDLALAGRTVYGARPLKGQELEDHYFGAISPRVLAFMEEVEERLIALGVPVKTRHNEVAPGQFELVPLYEEANSATDHNMLTMQILKDTARKHGFACILHEKPFAGINGSGKHNNWSLCDSDGNNLLEPGSTPRDNAQFLVFLAAIMRAVHKNPAVLRLGSVGAGNDHRLGANEAPPAIISIFLGQQLTGLLEEIADGGPTCVEGSGSSDWSCGEDILRIGVSTMPNLPRDISDRNRTSPIAFTGNKFEFRSVGSSMSIAPMNIAINTVVANALDDIASDLENAVGEGVPFNQAVQELLAAYFREHLPVVFNGNGYGEEWKQEAERRGLPNLKDTITTLARYSDSDVMEAFLRHGVLTEREMLARQEILFESYIRQINVEVRLALSLGRTSILPAAMAWFKEAGIVNHTGPGSSYYNNLQGHLSSLIESLDALEDRFSKSAGVEDTHKKAAFLQGEVLPALALCRKHADALEEIVDDGLWPLPKYTELLWEH